MLMAWQMNGDKYKEPFYKSSQAYYEGSDIKKYTEEASHKFSLEHPVIASAAPIAYSAGIKREIKLSSKKISLLPSSTTTYYYNNKAQTGSIGLTWTW